MHQDRHPPRMPEPPAASGFDLDVSELRAVVDHAGVGIVLVQQRRIVRCNQRFADIFGHAEPSAMGARSLRRVESNNIAALCQMDQFDRMDPIDRVDRVGRMGQVAP